MPKKVNAKKIERKIEEALKILESLGLPKQQQNERSALTLLSLLDLKPGDAWANAGDPLMGITPMMDYFAQRYEKQYAPNTRETVRRQTVHQFLQAALIVANPDKPSRPTNSPKAVYQIEPAALKLLREFQKPAWEDRVHEYLHTVKTRKRPSRRHGSGFWILPKASRLLAADLLLFQVVGRLRGVARIFQEVIWFRKTSICLSLTP